MSNPKSLVRIPDDGNEENTHLETQGGEEGAMTRTEEIKARLTNADGEAELIASPADIRWLLAEVERLQAKLLTFAERLDCRCDDAYTSRGRHGPSCLWDLAEEIREAVKEERNYISATVGGERPGDTLIRLAGLIVSVRRSEHVTTQDWREWLRDFGRRLNEAAEKAEEE
ncbi:hypothetical protein CMI37_14230 [Candidatus Pacearchaeota archaeon]|nr:hypothetical protein [Candidatus Pacearchaeota archaeon]|tara:strand:- start:316 stop:828 length:513 start_codon:yes stop_codon:yes gene_type:complete